MTAPSPQQSKTFILPWPPTVNQYYSSMMVKSKKTGRMSPRKVKSKRAREYARSAWVAARQQHPGVRFRGRLLVAIRYFEPDLKKRDIDNLQKGVLDGLTGAGVWRDDAQIDLLMPARCHVVKGGRAEVIVAEITSAELVFEKMLQAALSGHAADGAVQASL